MKVVMLNLANISRIACLLSIFRVPQLAHQLAGSAAAAAAAFTLCYRAAATLPKDLVVVRAHVDEAGNGTDLHLDVRGSNGAACAHTSISMRWF